MTDAPPPTRPSVPPPATADQEDVAQRVRQTLNEIRLKCRRVSERSMRIVTEREAKREEER